jgi:hypothetical protein
MGPREEGKSNGEGEGVIRINVRNARNHRDLGKDLDQVTRSNREFERQSLENKVPLQ